MNMCDITADDWKYIFTKYPGLEGRLTACSLYNESLRLTKELEFGFLDPRRERWIKSRLAELETLNLTGRID